MVDTLEEHEQDRKHTCLKKQNIGCNWTVGDYSTMIDWIMSHSVIKSYLDDQIYSKYLPKEMHNWKHENACIFDNDNNSKKKKTKVNISNDIKYILSYINLIQPFNVCGIRYLKSKVFRFDHLNLEELEKQIVIIKMTK